ncbi:MAG: alkaline phosphatase family protein, partial [Cellulosilyticaceae bacterium]
ANVSIFPNTLSGSGGKSAASYHVAHQYIPYKTTYAKIAESTHNKVNTYCISPFSSFLSSSVDEICSTIESICSKDGSNYIYTYWPQPDSDMHAYGTSHEQITAHILLINNAIEALCKNLKDTLLIVTADHGLIDTTWKFIVDYPDITECLLHKPSIEARAMTFFIKSGMHRQFEAAFKKHFGKCYKLYPKQQVLNDKLFGDGMPHPRSEGFIGDYLAIAHTNITIEYSPSPSGDIFKSSHAGMTQDELDVPFIVVDCTK